MASGWVDRGAYLLLMAQDLSESRIAELERMLARARRAVGFTGAGISTQSGIPDFRSPDSPWTRHKPIPFEVYLQSEEARREVWRRKFAMDDLHRGARPGTGHRALADLVRCGKMSAIVTQNIDGLHQASGVPADRVVELHGNGTYAACLSCGMRHELESVRSRFEASGAAPSCETCGGIVKSATISFGQAVPAAALRRAQAEALACDLFLAIGTSLVVQPAAALPLIAKRNGAFLVIVNREPTRLDSMADLVINAEIEAAFASFVPHLFGT
jgi:NAD-dependent deacetylase